MNIQADGANRSARVENRRGVCTKTAEKHGGEWKRIRKNDVRASRGQAFFH